MKYPMIKSISSIELFNFILPEIKKVTRIFKAWRRLNSIYAFDGFMSRYYSNLPSLKFSKICQRNKMNSY